MSRAAAIVALLGVLVSLSLPASARAWKQTFTERLYPGTGIPGDVSQSFTARKCTGEPLGSYAVTGRTAHAGRPLATIRFRLPVTPAWRPVTNVAVTVVDRSLPAAARREIDRALTRFYSTMLARWTPGRLHVRHQGLTVFGQRTLAPAQVSLAFAPEPGC